MVNILLDKQGRVTQSGQDISKKLGFNPKDLEDRQFTDKDIEKHI
jgi:biotin operon repressor